MFELMTIINHGNYSGQDKSRRNYQASLVRLVRYLRGLAGLATEWAESSDPRVHQAAGLRVFFSDGVSVIQGKYFDTVMAEYPESRWFAADGRVAARIGGVTFAVVMHLRNQTWPQSVRDYFKLPLPLPGIRSDDEDLSDFTSDSKTGTVRSMPGRSESTMGSSSRDSRLQVVFAENSSHDANLAVISLVHNLLSTIEHLGETRTL